MAAATRVLDGELTMATLKESGHYAIAGFPYQFIGSGVVAFQIYEGLQGDEPTEVLLVERFGQDAVVLPVDGSDKKPKLIQYKYSSKGETIAPSELREILQAFSEECPHSGNGNRSSGFRTGHQSPLFTKF